MHIISNFEEKKGVSRGVSGRKIGLNEIRWNLQYLSAFVFWTLHRLAWKSTALLASDTDPK
jgi:hypothetical protein